MTEEKERKNLSEKKKFVFKVAYNNNVSTQIIMADSIEEATKKVESIFPGGAFSFLRVKED